MSATPAAIEAVLQQLRATMPPLRGVIHSAALIDDAPLIKVDRELMHNVMAAKMLGAWTLHQATLSDALDHFVMYSSSSVVVGNPGQAVYVAANSFLNALAELRRARGLPALAVGWGRDQGRRLLIGIDYQQVIKGIVLLGAVCLDVYNQKR